MYSTVTYGAVGVTLRHKQGEVNTLSRRKGDMEQMH